MARRGRERLQEWIEAEPEAAAPLTVELARVPEAEALLAALFGNSPFLSSCLLREPAFFAAILEGGPDACLAAQLSGLRGEAMAAPDLAQTMAVLRRAKRRVALLTAIADIAGLWPLEQVTGALSDFADGAVSAAAARLLADAHQAGEIELPDPADPERGSGLVILGMGKLGGRELNYSSDIDLIVLYDAETARYRGRRSVQEMFVKLARDLVRLLEERTGEGYVFRTDLRLRPDPGSTPPAISVVAAETYYESFGQNWERAAMIKARQIAGDGEAGAAFLKAVKPFIWRRHLDFAAIADIRAIKRQIYAHKGGARIAVAGHNIKLGRGGIREIEFFVQTQQLIWGGRDPTLRGRETLRSLRQLVTSGHAGAEVAAELEESYRFLRRVEHRLQMVDDQQTQSLPNDPERLEALALFLGYPGRDAFAQAMEAALRTVERHYAALFEEQAGAAWGTPGPLVFSGAEPDLETVRTVAEMGFSNAPAVVAQIRGWHLGHARATRSQRAREMLGHLTPALLRALAGAPEPDQAFLRFASFLDGLPAGISIFALFLANPVLLGLVVQIMGSAPRLAEQLRSRPGLLDRVLSPDFFDPPGSAQALGAELAAQLDQAGEDEQEQFDTTRRWTNEQKFRAGVQILEGVVTPAAAALHLSAIAEATLAAVDGFVTRRFEAAHGRFPGEGAAILAMGKMGSREMTATSDLDLILVYDSGGAEASDGQKRLAPSAYYGRLAQRLINALVAKTPEGWLYDVDMRLRPSGNAGPIAASIESFTRYHDTEAWTWEHMALTRARIVTGSRPLKARIEAVIKAALTARRDPDRLVIDVAEMREKIFRQHGSDNPWEVKHRRGGLIDIEFIAQYLQLRHAAEMPEILAHGTGEALERARRLGVLAEGDADILQETLALWTVVQQILRQTVSGTAAIEAESLPLRQLLAQSAGQPDFPRLRAFAGERAQAVHALFQRLIAEPAAALTQAGDPGSEEITP